MQYYPITYSTSMLTRSWAMDEDMVQKYECEDTSQLAFIQALQTTPPVAGECTASYDETY